MAYQSEMYAPEDIDYLQQRIAELEHQLQERDHELETLRRNTNLLQQFFDNSPAVMFAKDSQGQHILSNRQLEAFYEVAAGELVGKTDDELFPSEVAAYMHQCDQQVLTSGEPIEVEDLIPDGDIMRAYRTIKFPIYNPQQDTICAIGGIATDITAHLQVEQELQQQRDFAEGLIETAPVIILVLDKQGRIVRFNPYMEELTGYSLQEVQGDDWLTRFLPERDHPRIQQIFTDAITTSKLITGNINPILTRNGTEREIEWYGKTLADSNEHVLGTLSIGVDITERLRYEREQEAVIHVASALRTAANPDEMVPILLEQVVSLLHAEEAELYLNSQETGKKIGEHATSVLATIAHKHLEACNERNEQAGKPYQPLIQNDIHNSQECRSAAFFPKHITAFACVPLIAQEETIGMLCTSSRQPFSESQIRLLTAIGDMAANALHRASLHEQTQQRLQHIQALRAIDRSITSSLDVYHPLQTLLEQVRKHLQVDAANVMLYNPVTRMLEHVACQGFHTTLIERTSQHIGEGYAGSVALNRRLLAIHTIAEYCKDARLPLLQKEQFVTYYGIPLVSQDTIKGVLEIFHRKPFVADQEWLDFLEAMADQAAIAIEHAELFAEFHRTNDELVLAYDATLEGWARALELRDVETSGHSQRVTTLTVRLARMIGIAEDEMDHIRRGAILHDVGKIAIPDSILLKPGPLTDLEYGIMQLHTTYAYDMLSPIPFLRPALDIPYCHHEKWDGTGYPRGLKGKDIPLPARMFAVVDVYDALRSDRPYRKQWSEQAVWEFLQEQSGKHFDPDVVEVFLQLMRNT